MSRKVSESSKIKSDTAVHYSRATSLHNFVISDEIDNTYNDTKETYESEKLEEFDDDEEDQYDGDEDVDVDTNEFDMTDYDMEEEKRLRRMRRRPRKKCKSIKKKLSNIKRDSYTKNHY